MKNIKKLLTLIIVVSLLTGVNSHVVKNVKAASDTINPNSKFGNIQLSLSGNTLTISGSGDYYDVNNKTLKFENTDYSKYMKKYAGTIKNIKVTNVTGITSTYRMFADLNNVKSIDISGLDTSNVENMYQMFSRCGNTFTGLSSLNLGPKFNTGKVKNMSRMFEFCGSITLNSLDLGSNFDTSNVENMSFMFNSCGCSMKSLKLGSKFDTGKVMNMESMFSGCGQAKLTEIDLGDKFDTGNVTNMKNMFSLFGSIDLIQLNLGDKFNTSKVTNMEGMFSECGQGKLESLNLGIAFQDLAVNCTGMFHDFGNYDTKIYANPELVRKIRSDAVNLELGNSSIRCVSNQTVDTTNIFKNLTKAANGTEQTFDVDLTNIVEGSIVIFYSENKELNQTNFAIYGEKTRPAYKGVGKHTIYYYIIKNEDISLNDPVPNSGSFTFEITCSHPKTEVRGKVDATADKDGYSGDTYCMMCDAQLAKGIVIPKVSSSSNPAKENPTGESPDGEVDGIKLNVTSIPLQKGQKTKKVTATVSDGDKIISYKSSNQKIARVSNSGVITGIKKGTAKITYTSRSGKTAVLTVKVQNGKVYTKQLNVTNKKGLTIKGKEKTISIKTGKTFKLQTEVTPITSADKITYKTSNKKIISVSSKGKLKAIAKGTATITIKSGKKYMKIKVFVK